MAPDQLEILERESSQSVALEKGEGERYEHRHRWSVQADDLEDLTRDGDARAGDGDPLERSDRSIRAGVDTTLEKR